ncbi:MAG: gliding motility lipoprotein GldH [Bacteroidales bacterium]|nr:gliding motility lipoprotein GldH [Bacteroidales bacterium]
MKNVFFLAVVLCLFSCSDTYRDFQSIKDMKWYRADKKTFEVDIKETGNYDLFFAMRYSTGYPFKQIKIKVTQKSPNGEEFYKNAEIAVANDKDEYIGDITGQLWDIEKLISKKTLLEKGKYVFEISHTMNSNPVVLVIDIGLIVRQTK